MESAGRSGVRPYGPALERAAEAQQHLEQIRQTQRAEYELRNLGIIEAYELGCGTRTIARRVGIAPTTVIGILASN